MPISHVKIYDQDLLSALFQIAIDRKYLITPHRITSQFFGSGSFKGPSIWGPRRKETRNIGNQERSSRRKHPGHFTDGDSKIFDIDQGQIADDKIKTAIVKSELFCVPRDNRHLDHDGALQQ